MGGRLGLLTAHRWLAAVWIALVIVGCQDDGPTSSISGTPSDSPLLGKAPAGTLAVSGTNPAASARDTTIDVHVFGSGFDRSAQVAFLLGGLSDGRVRTNSTTYVSQGEVVANVTIAVDAVPDQYDVQVALAGGKKGIGTEMFAVLTMIDLGLPAGGYSYGRDVNSSGVAVGEYAVPKTTCRRAYAWIPTTGSAIDLPLPQGTCISIAVGITESGVIVGNATVAAGQRSALRWTPAGPGAWALQPIANPAGYAYGDAMGISSSGLIVGAFAVTPNEPFMPFVWSEGSGWSRLQVPDAECWRTGGVVTAINASGQVAGGDCVGALIWTNPATSPVRLPDFGGKTAVAYDINDAGVAVGRVYNTAGQRRALRWTPDGAGGYSMQDLGDLGGGEADARTINNAGQVAGYSSRANGGGALRAVLWTPGRAIEELELLQSQGGSTALALSEAAGGPVYISGWGVGTARGSYQRAVRWTR